MARPIIVEGATATNQSTGERIVYRGGKWYPVGQDPAAPSTNPADVKLTEDQGKSGEYLALMSQAERAYRQARTEGYDPTTWRNGAAGWVEGIPGVDGLAPLIRDEVSDNGRRAEMQWSDAQLKAMSGAASPEAEVRRNARTYFPTTGQDLETAAPAFEDGRATAAEAVRRRAGPSGRGVDTPTTIGAFGRSGGFSTAAGGIGGLTGGGLGAASTAAPGAPAPPAATLPRAARAQLREGHDTRFANGQVWTMRNGQPVQVR